MNELFLVLGVIVLSFALRTFQHPVLRKLGAFSLLAASFLAVYFLTGNLWIGLLGAAAWFLLPGIEIVTRIRRLRLPLDKKFRRKFPPQHDHFPHLRHFTREIEGEDFEQVEDTGWESEEVNQFMRIFYHEERRSRAAICVNEQGSVVFGYIRISSRTRDGKTWMTWNYPFYSTMKSSPDLNFNRVTGALSFNDLLGQHFDFLNRNGVAPDQLVEEDTEDICQQIEKENRKQINHNLDVGLIRMADQETFRYSWRGCLYHWCQVLKDMVKLS